MRLLRDYIISRAGVELGNREDDGLRRRQIAADNGLKLPDQRGHDDDRIARMLRARRMAAAPGHANVKEIRTRHRGARFHPDMAGVVIGRIVHPVDFIAGKSVKEAVSDHRAGAAEAFLGGLKDQDDLAGEIPRLRQVARGAKQHGRVPVMAAGVHHAGCFGGEGEVRLLMYRQRVHVGAEADGLAWTVPLDDADDAGFPDAGMSLDPPIAQFFRNDAGGADLFETQFRVLMQVAADGCEFVVIIGDARNDGHGILLFRAGAYAGFASCPVRHRREGRAGAARR